MEQKLKWEKTLLNIYVSSHPFAPYEPAFKGVTIPLAEIENAPRDSWVIVGGVIDAATKKITKKGDIMMFVTLEDKSGNMELLVFPKTYQVTQALWVPGNCICVVGKTPKEEGDNKIFVENAYVIDKTNAAEVARRVSIGKAPTEAPQKEKIVSIQVTKEDLQLHADELKKIFADHPGEFQVFIKVNGNTIRATTPIDWNEEVENKIADLIGSGKTQVFQ